MSAQFTPGPWAVFGIRARFATISQADSLGRPSRHIAEMAWDNHDEYAPHDARLIAAAPALYEALAKLAAQYSRIATDVLGSSEVELADHLAFADNALKQARGEA